MAPEVVKQTSYTAKADIWSLGCLIVEMFTGQHPWMELTQMQAIFKIGSSKDARPKIPTNASPIGQEFLDLTFHMWVPGQATLVREQRLTFHVCRNYHERPTAAALSKHAFVTEEFEE
jgi:mitogen-activated protein kinase kinase kinase